MSPLARPYHPTPRLSASGMGVVVIAHVIIVHALLRMNVISLPAPLRVLSVSLLPPAPPTPEPPRPKVEPPKPRPVARRPEPVPVQHPVQLAAPAETPAPAATYVPPPAPSAPAPTVVAPAAAPVPTRPRFDADYLDNPKPRYPALSRKLGEQGRVMLLVRVGADGLPLEVRVDAGSGFPRLDNAALEAVRRWKFSPARLGEQAVAGSVRVPIDFSLKD